jgi:hypothetical protein
MSRNGVLDTSTLILLGRITAIETLPDAAFITAVTLAELSVGPLVATTEEDRVARQAHLQAAEADFDPIPSMLPPQEPSAVLRPRCGAAVKSQPLGPTTR